VVVMSNVGRRIVRLIGIDTPEVRHPDRGTEAFGPEASAFTKALLLPGTPVWLELDTTLEDAYGRLLAYVYRAHPEGAFDIDGTRVLMVNLAIAEAGWAKTLAIRPNVLYADLFADAVQAAQAAGVGMWSPDPPAEASPSASATAQQPPPPTTFIRAEAPLRIACALYHPRAGQTETVVIDVLEPFDTRGFALYDEGSGTRLRLPPGVQPPGALEVLTIGQQIWNNGGDTIYLLDPSGRLVDEWTYMGERSFEGRTLCRDGTLR